MGHIILKIFPDGRVERSERARSWAERRELLGYALYLQPGLAALDVAARLWRDLTRGRQTHPESDSGSGATRPRP